MVGVTLEEGGHHEHPVGEDVQVETAAHEEEVFGVQLAQMDQHADGGASVSDHVHDAS